jgi:4-coumarate--CoA ligase
LPLVIVILIKLISAQMEALLNCHPSIMDSAVFGLPQEDTGNDLPTAYVVRRNPTLTAEEVKEYIAENASEFKQLRGGVFFVDKIPKVWIL